MKKVDFCNSILHYIKMSKTTYYERDRETILNRANDYYENNKEKLIKRQETGIENYQKKKKNIKTEYGINRYYNISEEKNKD